MWDKQGDTRETCDKRGDTLEMCDRVNGRAIARSTNPTADHNITARLHVSTHACIYFKIQTKVACTFVCIDNRFLLKLLTNRC